MLAVIKESLFNFIKEKFLLLLPVCFLIGVISSFLVFNATKLNSLLNRGDSVEVLTTDVVDITQAKSENPNVIVVDLSGAVKDPGVYRLPEESRIADLLELGGGVLNEASGKWVSKNLNLSKKLVDSDKIYVPFEWEVTEDLVYDIAVFVDTASVTKETTSTTVAGTSTAGSGSKINVNTASVQALDTLQGIGEVYAQKIFSNRPYKDFNDLQARTKISVSTLEKIKDLIVY